MVNNENPYLAILQNLPNPPLGNDPNGDDREIGKNPLWSLEDFKKKSAEHSEAKPTLIPVTKKCRNDLRNLTEVGFDLAAHIQALTGLHFKNAVWCQTGSMWIPCDAYSLKASFTVPSTGYCGTTEYYFKMCKGLTGNTVVFVSIHQ